MKNLDKSSYVYTWTRPDTGDVFYVGMGRDARDIKLKTHNPHFMRIVEKLKRSGLEPIVARIADGLTRDEASNLEIREIARLGRKSDGGTLCNLTAGGEGSTKPSLEVIEKRTAALRKAWADVETRTLWVASLNSPETREKLRAAWSCPIAREKRIEANRASAAKPEVKAKRSASRIAFWSSPEGRETMLAANRRDEVREKKRQGSIRYNSDPKVIDKKREDQIRRYSDPEERKRTSDSMRSSLSNPELREVWREAQRSAPPRKDNKTGFKGVCYDRTRGKFVASIRDHGKTKYLGRFVEPQEAARAYDSAAVDAWGLGNCYLNFPADISVIRPADNDNIKECDWKKVA